MTLPVENIREKVLMFEQVLQQQAPIECPVRHIFAPGVYAREMTVPTGVVLTGAVHKTCHLSILSKGHVRVVTDDGLIELIAPATVISQPGAKRVIHAVEESVWTTIHATNETDLDKLVEELTESTADELQGGLNNKQFLNHQQQLRG